MGALGVRSVPSARSATALAIGVVVRRHSAHLLWMAVLSIAAVLSPEKARAGCFPTLTHIESGSVAPKFVDFGSPQFVQIPQFNPTLGMLCYAVVRISASYDALIKVENSTSSSPFITVSATETVTVQPPAFFAPVLGFTSHSESIPPTSTMVAPWDHGPLFSFTGPDTASFSYTPTNPRNATLANVAFSTLDAGFANFTGIGYLPGDFTVNGMGTYNIYSNAGSSNAQVNMQVGLNVEVEYQYVPEPGMVSLVLAAGWLCKRPRRRR